MSSSFISHYLNCIHIFYNILTLAINWQRKYVYTTFKIKKSTYHKQHQTYCEEQDMERGTVIFASSHSPTKQQFHFCCSTMLANFDVLKCPDYKFLHESIECALVFMINACRIF